MFLSVLTGLLLEIFVEGFDTARKSRSVVFLAERLENKLGFFALVRQLKPHVFLVAFRCAPTAHCSRSDLLEHLLQRWRQMLSLSDG